MWCSSSFLKKYASKQLFQDSYLWPHCLSTFPVLSFSLQPYCDTKRFLSLLPDTFLLMTNNSWLQLTLIVFYAFSILTALFSTNFPSVPCSESQKERSGWTSQSASNLKYFWWAKDLFVSYLLFKHEGEAQVPIIVQTSMSTWYKAQTDIKLSLKKSLKWQWTLRNIWLFLWPPLGTSIYTHQMSKRSSLVGPNI